MPVRLPRMYETLPPLLRSWAEQQAERMGLPGPDDYLLLLIRLDQQDRELERILCDSSMAAGQAA